MKQKLECVKSYAVMATFYLGIVILILLIAGVVAQVFIEVGFWTCLAISLGMFWAIYSALHADEAAEHIKTCKRK